MNTYVLVPFGDPVHAGHAEIIPPGIVFYGQLQRAPDLGNRHFRSILRQRNGKPRENRHFHGNIVGTGTGNQGFAREPSEWEREIIISLGIVLGGTTGTIFAREREYIPIFREILRVFARGHFPEDCSTFYKTSLQTHIGTYVYVPAVLHYNIPVVLLLTLFCCAKTKLLYMTGTL